MLKLILIALISLSVFMAILTAIKNKTKDKSQVSQRLKTFSNSDYGLRNRRNLMQQGQSISRGYNRVRDKKEIPFTERVLKPMIDGLGDKILSFTPRELINFIQQKLTLAGKSQDWSPTGFAVSWIVFELIMIYLGVRIVNNNPNMAAIQRITIFVMTAILGGLMPFSYLNILIQKRQKLIQKQLPEVLDLLSVSVQAGLTFDAAMRKIVERMKGPFIDECKRMLDDVRMGVVRRTSLKLMADRCGIQDVALFTTAIIQAERLGTSMANTLNNQAENMRERRRQYIKAEALKAPVKIIFPLVIFIFPALFVVVLLPAILDLMKAFK